MSKLERLLNLTAVLLNTARPLTAEELRQMVEGYPPVGPSFRRAFERDKDDLRELGIPLRVERVPATDPPLDGYRIPADEYYLPDPGLDSDELAALHLASMSVRLDGFGDEEALWKLGGTVTGATAPTGPSLASIPSDPNLIPLFGSITSNAVVKFAYRETERVVEPWRLDFLRGHWYLTGWDQVRRAERQYRLDRIEGQVAALTEHGEARAIKKSRSIGRRRQAWEMGEGTSELVELLVDERLVPLASQQFGDDCDRQKVDGGTVFEVPVVNEEAFRSFVFGFLEHAEILGPPDVRDRTVRWLSNMASSDDGRPGTP